VAGAGVGNSRGAADGTLGVGGLVVGLAAVIGGGALMTTGAVFRATLACIIGSILYRLAVAGALNADMLGLKAQDLNLITAVLVTLAMVLPGVRMPFRGKRKGGMTS